MINPPRSLVRILGFLLDFRVLCIGTIDHTYIESGEGFVDFYKTTFG